MNIFGLDKVFCFFLHFFRCMRVKMSKNKPLTVYITLDADQLRLSMTISGKKETNFQNWYWDNPEPKDEGWAEPMASLQLWALVARCPQIGQITAKRQARPARSPRLSSCVTSPDVTLWPDWPLDCDNTSERDPRDFSPTCSPGDDPCRSGPFTNTLFRSSPRSD